MLARLQTSKTFVAHSSTQILIAINQTKSSIMDIVPRKKYYIYPQRKCLKYVQLKPCAQWLAINQKKMQGGFYFLQSTTKFLAKTTTQKINFLVKDFFIKCKQIHSFLQFFFIFSD